MPADGIGEGPDDLLLSGLFHGAGTPVPYVSFSGPRWSTVGWDRRVTRDSTAPCTKDVSQNQKHMENEQKKKKEKKKGGEEEP